MADSTSWIDAKGEMVLLGSDPRLAAFKEVFLLLDLGATTIVKGCVAMGDTITGTAAIWGVASCRLELRYDPVTGSAMALTFEKTDAVPAFLSAIGVVPGSIKDRLVAAPAVGSSLGHLATSRELLGRLQLPVGRSVEFGLRSAGSSARSLQARFDPGAGPSLSDLASLLSPAGAAHDDMGDWLPGDLLSGWTVEVRSVRALFDVKDANPLRSVAVRIETVGAGGSPKTWNIIPGHDVLAVGDLWVDLDVEHPLEAAHRFPLLTIGGSIVIAGAHIDLSARWPDLAISGELRKGEQLAVGPLMRALGLPEPGTPMAITALGFFAETAQPRSFSFQLAISDVWSIDLGGGKKLEITELASTIRHDANGTSGAFRGLLDIADHPISVGIEHDGTTWAFFGETEAQAGLKLGDLLAKLAVKIGAIQSDQVPESLIGLLLQRFAIRFTTASAFVLDVRVSMPVGDHAWDAALRVTLTKGASGYETTVHGQLLIGTQQFLIDARKGPVDAQLIASWKADPPRAVDVGQLAKSAFPALADGAPQLPILLKDIFLAFRKDAAKGKALFGIDLGARVDLGQLPLVGQAFRGKALTIDGVKFLLASDIFTRNEVEDINPYLPGDPIPLPAKQADDETSSDELPKGASVSARVTWSGRDLPLYMGAANGPAAGPAGGGGGGAVPAAPAPDGPKWFKVDRSFGPVHLGRVGVQYQAQELNFLLDGSLGAGGISLSLIGLQVGSPITKFEPHFGLQGLGLSIQAGSVGITGAFMHTGDEYAGAALISLEKLTLGALGAYTTVNGHPSLFVYAVLDMPIGGPSFFFVTGLAAGFGYNRALRMPDIDQVAQFPLVAAAVNGVKNLDLTTTLQGLQAYIPPTEGERFFAIGIKFTSFKMIDSFALLAVSFGDRTAIDLLGLSTLVVPTPEASVGKDPLAVVQLALKASYAPDEGVLKVSAQLTSASYILSRACHLTGGFAFYSWFKGPHAGDFVLTLGGYHPHYAVPAHYPQVPRLAINWQVSPELSVKADAYFALTPSTLMAGGHLQVVWQSGDLKAWFIAGADFLIAWKPYHYEAHIYVDIGVSYSFDFFGRQTISADVGADLQVWGPEFAGIATVHLWIVDFDVRFGPAQSTAKKKISEASFNTMLPAERISCTVERGLVSKGSGDHLGLVNPKELRIVIESVIPISAMDGKTFQAFGRAPMDEKTCANTLTLAITHNGLKNTDLLVETLFKKQPSALWGTQGLGASTTELTEELVCGVGLSVAPLAKPDTSPSLDTTKAMLDSVDVANAFHWAARFDPTAMSPGTIPDTAFGFADWPTDLNKADYEKELLRPLPHAA